jgi:hypothetical protein
VYDVSFWARSDALRMMHVIAQLSESPWSELGLSMDVLVDTYWQEYRYSFRANATTAATAFALHFGYTPGTTWVDDISISERPPDVMRRDFEGGVVLLNASDSPQTIALEPGLRRFTGTQAARYQIISDDDGSAMEFNGDWQVVVLDGAGNAAGFANDWGAGAHVGTGEVIWDLNIPEADVYSLAVWLPAAPDAANWNEDARYEIISDGAVVLTSALDQRAAGDTFEPLGTVSLAPGAFVRLLCTDAPCVADALYAESEARYHDGSPVSSITLAPLDGILLGRD